MKGAGQHRGDVGTSLNAWEQKVASGLQGRDDKGERAPLVPGTRRAAKALSLQDKPFTRMQVEILRAIYLHGGVTSEMTNRHGWTSHGGLPKPEFAELIERMIVAPRVLTAHPLRVVWQLRNTKSHAATLSRIEKESRRLKLKEHAPGGFRLTLRKELR